MASPLLRQNWLPCVNVGSNDIGRHAPVQLVGIQDDSSAKGRKRFKLKVQTPQSRSSSNQWSGMRPVGFSGSYEIAQNKDGIATFEYPAIAHAGFTTYTEDSLLVAQDGTNELAAIGTKAGGICGIFLWVGDVGDESAPNEGLVMVQPILSPRFLVLTPSAWPKDTTKNVDVYRGQDGTGVPANLDVMTDTGVNITAYNRFARIESGKWAIVELVNGVLEVTAGEC